MQSYRSIDHLAEDAREHLPAMVRGYYDSGARSQQTLADNRHAWERTRIRYRVLAGSGQPDLRTRVLDTALTQPILAAPTAFHKLAHPEGERATAHAVGDMGSVMCLSTLATTDVEEVCAAAPGRTWFQLYVYRDRGATRALVERALAAGCRALVLTVDAPVLGTRWADVDHGFHLPDGIEARNVVAHGYGDVGAAAGDSGLAAYVRQLLDPMLTWEVVDWLRSFVDVPVLVKGVVRGDDAVRAFDHGAAGVVVSNHGGRQLDHAVPTAWALAEVAEAVEGRGPVLVDGGIRTGTDVLKALALGADAVLLGRPVLYGLAVGGREGVAQVFRILRAELAEAMALAGCPDVAAIHRDLVVPWQP